jgi:Ca2+-binding RTX toxin-like protein
VPYDLSGLNVINGTAAAESIAGTAGNDAVFGNGGADTLSGGLGKDILFGGEGGVTFVYTADATWGRVSSVNAGDPGNPGPGTSFSLSGYAQSQDVFVGTGSDNVLLMGDGRRALFLEDSLSPNVHYVRLVNIQTIVGGSGGQIIDLTSSSVGYGSVTILGGSGNDVLMTSGGADTVSGGDGADYIWGGSGNDSLSGGIGNDTILGGNGDDRLDGGTGNDSMTGGAGNDTYVVDAAGDAVVESAGQGTDLVLASITYTLGANVEHLTLTGAANLNGTGNTLNNFLIGTTGNNTLDGGTGNDTMAGGAGDDTYVADATGDTVTENAGEGTDLVRASVSYTLSANVENLTLTGTSSVNGTGNALANVLTGNSGANTLNGAEGADTMAGGAGNDTYVVDETGDVVTELAAQGTDTVLSSIDYTLGAELERLTLIGAAHLSGTGNALANVITGNAGNNVLDGGAGADTLQGGAGDDLYKVETAADTVLEAADDGTDRIESSVSYTLGANVENLTLIGIAALTGTGNALNNDIVGNDNDNVLDGGAGSDTLTGGAGNDTYVVDASGDVIVEGAGGGLDTVNASASYVLSANLENLTLAGTAAINGTGNALDNVIAGNSAANILDGGPGADSMAGGAGNDTYVVDDAGDVVTEALNQGTDLVLSSLSYSLGVNVENLTLTGTAAIDGTGNSLNNKIIGNASANVLDGGAGRDTMNGGYGNDTLIGGAENDSMFGEWGDDTIYGNDGIDNINGGAGNDYLVGGAGNDGLWGGGGFDLLIGEAGNDKLYGDGGNDTIIGGAGNDYMYGGQLANGPSAGNDLFLWSRSDIVNDLGVRVGYDQILDFAAGDVMDFSAVFDGEPDQPIGDIVGVRDSANGTIVSLHMAGVTGFIDTVLLRGIHGMTLDQLVAEGGILV